MTKTKYPYRVKRIHGNWAVVTENKTFFVNKGTKGTWYVNTGGQILATTSTLRDGIINVLVSENLL